MNKFAKDMLMARYGGRGDGRNPYGSRGGYVTSRRPRRDRDMEDYGEDYARGGRGGRGGRRGGGRGGRDYADYDMERGGRDYGDYDMRRRDYGDDEEDMRRRDYGDMGEDYRRRDYGDYDMRRQDYGEDMRRWDEENYDMRYRDYGDYRRGRDYGETEYGKLSKKDMEEWKKNIMNADGSHGEHFKKEQVEQMTKQMGLNVDKMGGLDVFLMTMNMMYSDYCSVAKKFGVDRPEYYAELAKAFLEDKDSTSQGEEKLWVYYKTIVEKE